MGSGFYYIGADVLDQVGIVTTEKVELLDDIKSDTENASSVDVKTKPLDDDADRALLLTGDDLESLSSADWDTIIGTYTEIVFARTTPEQKLGIVEEIKARGDNTVAVTGVRTHLPIVRSLSLSIDIRTVSMTHLPCVPAILALRWEAAATSQRTQVRKIARREAFAQVLLSVHHPLE